MTVRDLLGVIRTRWRLIAFCMLVVVGATAATTIVTTPVYEATARIYLETEKAVDNEPSGSYAITQKDLNTYVAILGSPAVQDPLREVGGGDAAGQTGPDVEAGLRRRDAQADVA